jgi:hypothetical protein
MKNSKTLLLVTLILLASVNSCTETDDFGPYYEGIFEDEIIFLSELDTTNIILEAGTKIGIIPYSIEDNSDLSDSIKLKLYISFGSYKEETFVIKEINQVADSVYIWYSTVNRFNKSIFKNNSISGVQTSPKPQYVYVDSVVIYKAESKFIKFLSRIIR